MNGAHSTYETLRHFADSWGLLGMVLTFLVLILWPFRPGADAANQSAANLIFADETADGAKGGEYGQ